MERFYAAGSAVATESVAAGQARQLYYTPLWYSTGMAHTTRDREKLVMRIKRIRGQVDGIQRMLDESDDCFAVLQTVAACRGALTGLMTEVIEGHVREHILDPTQEPTAEQRRASEQLIEVLRAFLR
jgi:DNA-binding FrmR family transcriptional regulator